MSDEKKYPLLGNGEKLIEPIKKKFSGGEIIYPYSYQESKEKVSKKISFLKNEISKIPEDKKMKEVIATVRLNEKFLAKSYTPNTFFREAKIENIGSRRWVYNYDEEETFSKLHFVKLSSDSLTTIEELLSKSDNVLSEAFKNDIRKLEDLSLLSEEEVIQGFNEDWNEGRVEFVLHPFGDDTEEMVNKFKKILFEKGVKESTLKVKSYNEGPIFVSAIVKRVSLNDIAAFNPLRTVHPLKVNLFPELRAIGNQDNTLLPPLGKLHSNIKVGVFDGGINQEHPYLRNFARENTVISTLEIPEGILHGTAVAGAVLYGDLSEYEDGHQLEDPLITLESFRVLPTSDPYDFELYEAIDIIETVVPSRNDIKVYNLSFGPAGAILDDEISRFTFALDRLAWHYRKLFVVAVGNDGDLDSPLNRIQSPADMVNGLGVGAFTYDRINAQIKRASYSCIGEGREGCKVKPDICGFGGDRQSPIQLLLHDNPTKKHMSAGTSFAAPLIAGKAAEILGRCEQFDPLVARALLIHAAKNNTIADNELGYGFINQSVEDIINCEQNAVTIIYSNSIQPTHIAKLPIPLPNNITYKGKVEVSWTIAVLSKANVLHSDEYTQSGIVDTFYPHDKKYKFSKGKKSVTKNIESDAKEIAQLISEGSIKSSLPATASPEKYQTERAKRGELKWDTVVKRSKGMMLASLENPFLTLHGMGRHNATDRIDYATIVTIRIPKYAGNLYEDILNEYRVLEPIRHRANNEIMVPIR
ncbi:S8 family peptidase [Peribacillus simplex]